MSYFHQSTRRRLASVLLAAFALLVIAGCSSGSGDSTTDSGAPAYVGGAAADQVEQGDDIAGGADLSSRAPQGGGGQQTDLIDVTARAQIKTAAISLEADDVDKVLQQVSDVTVLATGEIASEDTSTNRKGQAVRSRLVLRVPVDEFETTVAKLSDLGVLHSLARSVEDVTADVADIDSRVRSAQDSIAQLRRLFAAAKKLGDIIALENELSQREADLEALQAQQRALAEQTALSTITVTVSQISTPPPPADDDDRPGGFIAGLKSGWHALVTFVLALSHGIGVALPIGTLLLVVIALVGLLVRRFTPRMRPRASE